MFFIPVAFTFVAIVGWYIVAMLVFVPATQTMVLSEYNLFVYRLVTWLAFGVVAFTNIAWHSQYVLGASVKKRRMSDGEWRSNVFMGTALVTTLLAALAASFLLADSGLSTTEIDGLRLLTPITGYEALLGALCFTPALLALGLYVLFGHPKGNAINPHIN